MSKKKAPTARPAIEPATISAANSSPFARANCSCSTSIGTNACAVLSNNTSHEPITTRSAISHQIEMLPRIAQTAMIE